MTRKIVQIVNDEGRLYALCDDGSVWKSNFGHRTKQWDRQPDIPQDAPPTEQEEEMPLDAKPTGFRDRLGLENG
jgi:hypothetical protein